MLQKLWWHLEIRRLKAISAQRGRPALPELVTGHNRHPVWRVTVPGHNEVYMCMPSLGGDGHVIHVDALKFNIAWLQSGSGLHDSCKLRHRMLDDYKFKHAVSGFAQGINNPVPLADVSYLELGRRAGIRFTNGMTRSFWLLANDAPAFPVYTDCPYSIEKIHELAGLEDPIPLAIFDQ